MFRNVFLIVFGLLVCSLAEDNNNYYQNVLNFLRQFLFRQNIRSGDVNFSWYTPKNYKLDITEADDLNEVYLVAPLKFIVHGWIESPARPYFKAMSEAYFKRGDYNVVYVNWSLPAAVEYNNAIRNTIQVGCIIANFIINLRDRYSVNLDDVHILGHSLGAHVAGSAGRAVYKRTGDKIGRLTGLDPAGPLFGDLFGKWYTSLNQNDAKMVDVVHTDGGVFGYGKPLGTVDFFPNCGVSLQPGCSLLERNDKLFQSTREYVFCSHIRSIYYYIYSINSDDMIAVRCKSPGDFKKRACNYTDTIVFGEDTPNDATGNYFLEVDTHFSTKI